MGRSLRRDVGDVEVVGEEMVRVNRCMLYVVF